MGVVADTGSCAAGRGLCRTPRRGAGGGVRVGGRRAVHRRAVHPGSGTGGSTV